jgi:hypothetical protein
MSRSYRKPFIKDKPRNQKRTTLYWKPIRHNWRQHLKQNYLDHDLNFESPKTYINDYDYCDYWFEIYIDKEKDNKMTNFRGWTKEDVKKYSRK